LDAEVQVRDGEGREFTTFRPQIGREAAKFQDRRARIEFELFEKLEPFKRLVAEDIREGGDASDGGSTSAR
jgi:hypothetical protein